MTAAETHKRPSVFAWIRENLIGPSDFYRHILALMIPMMVESMFTNMVNTLDNIMVGRLGNLEMSGVSIANQLTSVLFITAFGAISATSIFGTQFAGKDDEEGLRNTFRIKLLIAFLLCAATAAVYFPFGDKLIGLYLKGKGDPADAAAILHYARKYLNILMIGLPPYLLSRTLTGALQEVEQTKVPMMANTTGVLVNLLGNYLLIFGKLGLPQLGIAGAAISTVISRYISAGIKVVWIMTHSGKQTCFAKGVFRHFRIPGDLLRSVVKRGCPLLANEFLYSVATTLIVQCASLRDLNVTASLNIATTFSRIFMVASSAAASALGILVGRRLGKGEFRDALRESRLSSAFAASVTAVLSAVFFFLSRQIPLLYNVSDEVRAMATQYIRMIALTSPFLTLAHCCYFTVRSGGRTFMTMLYDTGLTWLVQWLPAFILAHFTEVSAYWIYGAARLGYLIRTGIGIVLVESRIWIRNIVGGSEKVSAKS